MSSSISIILFALFVGYVVAIPLRDYQVRGTEDEAVFVRVPRGLLNIGDSVLKDRKSVYRFDDNFKTQNGGRFDGYGDSYYGGGGYGYGDYDQGYDVYQNRKNQLNVRKQYDANTLGLLL